MFDAKLRPIIDPPLNAIAGALVRLGVPANALTIAGTALGILAGVAVGQGAFLVALGLVILNRLFDGLDGAVARTAGSTDFGGYLDIVADFVFYVSVPIGFGFAAGENLPYAMMLIATFALTGVSFLAFAAIAAKRGDDTVEHGRKAFFYSTGIAEGTETIAAFVAMCILPTSFAEIATGFAVLCILTVFQRTLLAVRTFR